MMNSRYLSLLRWGAIALFTTMLAACGGGDGDGGGTTPPPSTGATVDLDPDTGTGVAFDGSIDDQSEAGLVFTAVQGDSVVTIQSPPKVLFAVIDDGVALKDPARISASFIIAKLEPGVSGNPDQFHSYTYRTQTGVTGPGGTPVLAEAKQATTDPKTGCATAEGGKITVNAAGVFEYTFCTDITDPTKTNGIVYEPGKVHRLAIQLSYTNAAGETVRINPYYDFTIDGSGKSVPATARKMADVNNCNTCHNQLALHGGGRVDVQFCVMCHNDKTVDPDSGNVLEMRTMVHKIHAGRRLAAEGENYSIWGFGNTAHDYSEVGFPQDLRNCSKCHNATTDTPQGDNWKSVPTKQACLTCHQSGNPSAWHDMHINVLNLGTSVNDVQNNCVACHGTGTTWGSEQVHFNQNEENAAKYKVVIESAQYSNANRQVTIKYYVEDPTNNNTKWDLNADCTGAAGSNGLPTCNSNNRFGNLRMYVAYNNIPGQPVNVTEFSSYNNQGGGVNALASSGTRDANNVYTLVLPIPADIPGITQAKGTAQVLSVGQAKEALLNVVTRTPVQPVELINVSMMNTFRDFAISGTVTPRKQIVSNEKCNACHGLLGTASGSNELNNAFHGGARNTIESCGALCHDAMRPGQYTVMNDDFKFPASVLGGAGVTYTMNQSMHLKRMIHGIHGGARTQYDFLHGSRGVFDPDLGTYTLTPENLTAEVAFPGILSDCNTCHVNNSYTSDRGTIGSALLSSSTTSDPANARYNENFPLRSLLLTNVNGTDYVDALKNPVISPKAASCTSCHDTVGVIQHAQAGGASFGNVTQGQFLNGFVFEACEGCHAPGGFVGVDAVHNIPLQGNP